MITDEQIQKVFSGTVFGPLGETPLGRRELVAMGVMKLVAGYRPGHTVGQILQELKMTTKMYGMPIKKARRWAYDELLTRAR